jgi:hypothetical protein
MKEATTIQKTAILGIFFFLIGSLFTLVIALLPKGGIIIAIFIVLIIVCFLYDPHIVRVLGLEMAWWSPHQKKLDLDDEIIKNLDPEITLILYFLDNNFWGYSKRKRKEGFVIAGYNKEVTMRARYKTGNLKINFYPSISKKTIQEIKKFKKHLEEFS